MMIYTIYVADGANSFTKEIECDNCIPCQEGYYKFYNEVKGKKPTVATYPIAITCIMDIRSTINLSTIGTTSAKQS